MSKRRFRPARGGSKRLSGPRPPAVETVETPVPVPVPATREVAQEIVIAVGETALDSQEV